MATHEKRRFSRVSFHAPARLVDAGGHGREVEILDLSMRGALVRLSDGSSPQGALCDPQSRWTLELSLSEEDRICMEVQPAHWHEQEVGLRCERIDLDSMVHLRSLLEANLGDVDLVNRELMQLVS
ncbi:PilZ domain-containing protein [Halorhodospira sp. 9621]|uniref:PilZ domain-containing protein n=1 Tax=Halorhodospira TaxID=85108 RepID=UPI001911FC39|nr:MULTISPECIES: PilZ domain-containing protein [Halorhodospira]MBK5942931.1 hypothetical protein [Halorhodospira halophila]MCG5528601.1 PilZ domain-containing protein [Halorhodospira halophila]MCG5533558.1 PilZ domain-containing protein [Halorhodospira sp. 9621]MCG5537323.1 PilZ domain-containing protein [Halorhodospira sp. 9622]MCG5543736.1 PilZ domain-containing protein [Halorhodospira sp. 9628]